VLAIPQQGGIPQQGSILRDPSFGLESDPLKAYKYDFQKQ
jgi:hypothetical protein